MSNLNQSLKKIGLASAISLPLFFGNSAAFAQSQFSGAVGQASASAAQANLEAFQRGQLDLYALGGSFGNISGLGAAAVGGARLRETAHKGFNVNPQLFPPATVSYGADIKEVTTFGSVSVAIPGTILGGRMRIGVIYGQTNMDVEAKPNTQLPLPVAGAIGSARVENEFYGGSALWSGEIGYISAAGLMTSGTSKMTDRFICCIGNIYNEKHDGHAFTVVAGRVFPIIGNALKVDLRGGYGFTKTAGDPFDALAPPPFIQYAQYHYATSSAWFSPMLFADIEAGGIKFRPYAQATFKSLFRYTNTSQFIGVGAAVTDFSEDKNIKALEGGINIGYANFVLGAAIYHESSAMASTSGAKLGLTYQF